MSNYNKVKTEGVESFEEKWMDKGDERYGLVKHNNNIVQQQSDWLSTFAEKVHKATLEDNAQELRNILNRCKTERGLGVAIANYIKTLTK